VRQTFVIKKNNTYFMKKQILFTLFMAMQVCLVAQTTGKWFGKMIINQSNSLTVAFEVSKDTDGKFAAVMHSVDQKAYNIPADSVRVDGSELYISIVALAAEYNGTIAQDSSVFGHMSFPGGVSMKLDMQYTHNFPFTIAERPQEPKLPLPYMSKEVEFENTNIAIKLRGTLTIPGNDGPYPAIVLISGSGASDRNQTIFGHKTFLVMSDFLTRAGFAVLRYDDRGAAESEGSFLSATILDHAEDAAYAIDFLKSREFVDTLSIGLLGHSLGADIAPVTCSMNPSVSFAILMAGAAKPLKDIIVEQCDAIYPTMGISAKGTQLNKDILEALFAAIECEHDIKKAKEKGVSVLESFESRAQDLFPGDKEKLGYTTPLTINTWGSLFVPYMKHDLFHDNAKYLEQIKCPVLVIGGDKDLQVLPHHVKLIEEILVNSGNKNVTAKLYPGKNHLMQDAQTGAPSEYGDIKNTIAPDVINDIIHWIRTNACSPQKN
jgi:pimeloyl-ACP methyl ester carboxylesterase